MDFFDNSNDIVIDLTNSFTLVDHCALANAVIDLDTDDSYIDGSVSSSRTTNTNANFNIDYTDDIVTTKSNRTTKRKKSSSIRKNKRGSVSESDSTKLCSGFGGCPICWDELGKNPLASTKCGHVFCLKCLEKCLVVEKKCPTCRRVLSGKSAYHPLYLNRSKEN